MMVSVGKFRDAAGWLSLAVLLFALPAAAQVIQSSDPSGRTVWTNDAVQARKSATESAPALYYWSNNEQRWKLVRSASPHAIRTAREAAGEVASRLESHPSVTQAARSAAVDKYIEQAAAKHHVDPNLVRALVKVESNYNPSAVSPKGAMGLMQLMPATARLYDVSNPYDPAQNVDAGVRHLKGLLENFKGNVPLSLAAYNAGQGAVERSHGIPPYSETRNYVRRITELMGSNALDANVSRMAHPIEVHRDESGRLTISNVD